MKWFRLYSEFAHDPKLRTFSKAQRHDILCLMCLASESRERGVILLDDEDVAASLDLAEEEFAVLIGRLQKKQIARRREDGRIELIHWMERQYDKPSDTPEKVRERVAKHRAGQQELHLGDTQPKETHPTPKSNIPVTPCNAPVTPHIRLRTDSEQTQSRTDNPPPTSPAQNGNSAPAASFHSLLDDAGLAVCLELQAFFLDEETAARQVYVHGAETVHWQAEAMRWRIEHGQGVVKDMAAYLLNTLEKKLPLPAAIRERRDAESMQCREKAQETECATQRADQAAREAAGQRTTQIWESLAHDEQADIECEAKEWLLQESSVRELARRKPEVWHEGIGIATRMIGLRNAILAKRGHVPSPSGPDPPPVWATVRRGRRPVLHRRSVAPVPAPSAARQ